MPQDPCTRRPRTAMRTQPRPLTKTHADLHEAKAFASSLHRTTLRNPRRNATNGFTVSAAGCQMAEPAWGIRRVLGGADHTLCEHAAPAGLAHGIRPFLQKSRRAHHIYIETSKVITPLDARNNPEVFANWLSAAKLQGNAILQCG